VVDFTAIINSSERIIASVGREVFIERNISTTDTDSAKPWLGKTSNTERHKVLAAFVNFEEKDIDGTLVKMGDQQCLISPKGLCIEITTDDLIVDDYQETTWTIVAAKFQKPGDIVLIYNLQVRS
jgi:hypothetical protein